LTSSSEGNDALTSVPSRHETNENCRAPNPDCAVWSSISQHKFATSSKSTAPRAAEYCHGGEPHHSLEDCDVFSWPIASFSAQQDMLGLTGCPRSKQSTSNTTNESQKIMVSILPTDHFTSNLCFLVQLGAYPCQSSSLTGRNEWQIHVS